MLHYLLVSTVAFSLLFALYELVLRRFTFFAVNRFYLLAIAVCSALLPLISIETDVATLPAVVLDTVVVGQTFSQTVREPQFDVWLWMYGFGVLVAVVVLAFRLLRVWRLLHRFGQRDAQGIAWLPGTAGAAFSFFGVVFMDRGVPPDELPVVLAHERVHVRQRHTLDVLLYEVLSCVWWFNPLYRLALRRLRMTHEFIADEQACAGNRVQYSGLLLARALGVPHSTLVHSMFHASLLKRRIKMLRQSPTRGTKRASYLLALPLLGVLVLCNSFMRIDSSGAPVAPDHVVFVVDTPVPPPPPPPVPPAPPAKPTPPAGDITPAEFQGGQAALMSYLAQQIVYPEEARTQKLEGKVFIVFVIDKTGAVQKAAVKKSAHPLLDAEALRVVKNMPAWKPAMKKGQPVSSEVVLPVMFKL